MDQTGTAQQPAPSARLWLAATGHKAMSVACNHACCRVSQGQLRTDVEAGEAREGAEAGSWPLHLLGEAQQHKDVAADDEARREVEPEGLVQHILAGAVPAIWSLNCTVNNGTLSTMVGGFRFRAIHAS